MPLFISLSSFGTSFIGVSTVLFLSSSCYGVRDCYWCEAEQKCVEHTECCSLIDGPQSCCGDSVQVDRFLLFASTCLRFSTECMRCKILILIMLWLCMYGYHSLQLLLEFSM